MQLKATDECLGRQLSTLEVCYDNPTMRVSNSLHSIYPSLADPNQNLHSKISPFQIRKPIGTETELSILAFVDRGVAGWSTRQHPRHSSIFQQGGAVEAAFFILDGWVKISTVSSDGKMAVVGLLSANDVLGESCAGAALLHNATATAIEQTTVIRIEKRELWQMLHHDRAFSKYFMQRLLNQKSRLEHNLLNQLFNSSEKRLAHILLMVAERNHGVLPRVNQETLAAMVGTTRSRISYFIHKLKQLGILQGTGAIQVSVKALTEFIEAP
jgi:CRP/FNR family cyclic AMP-dependent transcriptional regulator